MARDENNRAYLIGGGIGSLAAAAFMIRDGGMRGESITILESLSVVGGSLDGAGRADRGYSMRGGRMLTTDTYECTWDLYRSIPSLQHPGTSVYDETVEFNEQHRLHARARLVDKQRAKLPVRFTDFSMREREQLLALASADEERLERTSITDWLSPAFFETEFWLMWSTTFAFQPWHSAIELKRYLHRFALELPRLGTLESMKRTVFNQYDSMILPLRGWLRSRGVCMLTNCLVTKIEHETVDGKLDVTGIRCVRDGENQLFPIQKGDVVFLVNGSMTDASTVGTMDTPPAKLTKRNSESWALWEDLARGRSGFGDPSVFNSSVAQSCWHSFTVTLKQPRFFDAMCKFTGNEAGTGGLVTFKDSAWLLSIALSHQPEFADQPSDVQVFWGYGLFPDRIGDFVAKPMEACSGKEILRELCGHLRFEPETVEAAICLPCRMPYITSVFMQRGHADRPLPVPRESRNLAFIGQFVEIPDDVVFTFEYSIRAAQMAVYELLGVKREVPPVTPHDGSRHARLGALIESFE